MGSNQSKLQTPGRADPVPRPPPLPSAGSAHTVSAPPLPSASSAQSPVAAGPSDVGDPTRHLIQLWLNDSTSSERQMPDVLCRTDPYAPADAMLLLVEMAMQCHDMSLHDAITSAKDLFTWDPAGFVDTVKHMHYTWYDGIPAASRVLRQKMRAQRAHLKSMDRLSRRHESKNYMDMGLPGLCVVCCARPEQGPAQCPDCLVIKQKTYFCSRACFKSVFPFCHFECGMVVKRKVYYCSMVVTEHDL